MIDDTEKLAKLIGTRVKNSRSAHGWTLDQLAAAAGVSRRMIVNIEQGATNPSLETLLKLSDALGIGLPALVEVPEENRVKLTRADQGAKLWTGKKGGSAVLVAGTEPPDVVELWDWHLGPRETHVSGEHSAGTKELVHLLEGKLRIDVDGTTYDLDLGDSLSYPGDVAHSYTNPGTGTARFTMSVYEPGIAPAHVKEASHDAL